jgi:hypothetical protein
VQQRFNTIAISIVSAESSAWRAASLCLKVNSLGINGKPVLFFLSIHGDGTYCFVVALQEWQLAVGKKK